MHVLAVVIKFKILKNIKSEYHEYQMPSFKNIKNATDEFKHVILFFEGKGIIYKI